ncbi:MAG: hypothetical protein JWQ84_2176 [Mucilaginibacter sp.]|jgi:hypothetical protein|nr:hypothetical protein [Mucilaginibacter sp.]MDB5139315.1 hypothetical protein [Mucilaginibacter sp.]
MINQTSYNINTSNGPVHLTITPINQLLSNGDYYVTGIFKLSDGVVGMGDITFNEDMSEWDYNGIDELTYDEAAEVAEFIKSYKDLEGADPDQLT